MIKIKQRLIEISDNCRDKGITHAEKTILDALDYIRLLEATIIHMDELIESRDKPSTETVFTINNLCKLIKQYQ